MAHNSDSDPAEHRGFLQSGLFRYALASLAAYAGIAVVGILLGWGYLNLYVDRDTIKFRQVETTARQVVWEEPESIEDRFQSLSGNLEASFSASGDYMVLSRVFSPGNSDLYWSRRSMQGWTKPQPIARVNSDQQERYPHISSNGRFLFFSSDREGGEGGLDLYVSQRLEDGWDLPKHLGSLVNTEWDEMYPVLNSGLSRIYFSSNRPVDRDPGRRDADLYFSQFEFSQPGVFEMLLPVPLTEANSPANEYVAALNDRGDIVYFNSDRPGGLGGLDVYRMQRVPDGYTKPENMGYPLNSVFEEVYLQLHRDGFEIYLVSNRDLRDWRNVGFYRSVTREVATEIDDKLLLNALLALLFLFVAVWTAHYLVYLLLSSRIAMRTITRCILASLLIHLLLLALSGSWYLSSQVDSDLRGPGPPMTINLSNLARESISLAVRESVAALPEVRTAPNTVTEVSEIDVVERNPTPAVPTPPVPTVTPSQNDAVAEQFPVRPVQRSASIRSVDMKVNLTPLDLGSAEVVLDTPAGAAAQSGSQEDGDQPRILDQEPSRPEVRPETASTASRLTDQPMPITPSQATDSSATAQVADRRTTPPQARVFSRRLSDGIIAEISRVDEVDRGSMVAGSTSLSRSFGQSLGTLAFKPTIPLEMKEPEPEEEEEDELGLLKIDPNRVLPLSLRLQLEALRRNLFELNYRRFYFFDFMSFDRLRMTETGVDEHSLGRVGGDLADRLPGFMLPAARELEVPEQMR